MNMKSDKFFKWIWNFNGIALFVGLLILALVTTYQFASFIFKDESINRPVLNLAEDNQKNEKWSLGYPQYVGNTDFYYIPLESEKLNVERKRTNVRSFSGDSYTPTRSKNVILINGKTNESSWLFKSIDQLILDIQPLLKDEFDVNSITPGLSYEVINTDTNQDGQLSNIDKRTFAVSKIDGSNYTEIISGYSRIVKSNLNTEGNLFVVFINDDEVYSMVIDMSNFKILDNRRLPKVGETSI